MTHKNRKSGITGVTWHSKQMSWVVSYVSTYIAKFEDSELDLAIQCRKDAVAAAAKDLGTSPHCTKELDKVKEKWQLRRPEPTTTPSGRRLQALRNHPCAVKPLAPRPEYVQEREQLEIGMVRRA